MNRLSVVVSSADFAPKNPPASSRLYFPQILFVFREEYIEKVRNAAKKSRNPYVSVIWSEGGAQPEMEQAVGMTFGYPALVAMSIEKKVSAVVLDGLRSTSSVRALLSALFLS